MTPLQQLTELDWQVRCANTRMRPDYVAKKIYLDKTANALTHAIISWINLNGYQAERISTTGRYIDNSKIVTDVLGNRKKIGSGKYIKGTGTNGSADISAIIKSLNGTVIPWKIEVKMKDKQSEAQKRYEEHIMKAGGHYSIVHNFDEFMEQYNFLLQNK
jgi:hypothetical protein